MWCTIMMKTGALKAIVLMVEVMMVVMEMMMEVNVMIVMMAMEVMVIKSVTSRLLRREFTAE